MSLFERPLAIVDLETTGGDPRADRVTEVGVILVDGERRQSWSSLVNPGVSIPLSIQRFTGITDDMVAAAPRFADIAPELAERLHGRLFVAHNARFDQGFLRNEFARVGLDFSPRVLCTVKLSRTLYPQFPRHGLDALIERFGLACAARHRALDDARLVLDFLDIATRERDAASIESAMDRAARTTATPPGLPAGALDDVPDAPGVYLFYGEAPASSDLLPATGEMPLYVGKSRNLRSRVLAHFTGSHKGGQAARMLRETRRVDWVETAGELGALLLEARLVKQLQPLYNRQLRASGPAVALLLHGGPGEELAAGEVALKRIDLDRVLPHQLAGLYGPFRSRRDCTAALRDMATAWQLCPKRIGLQEAERHTAACVNVQVRRCRGVCCGREDPRQHDLRLMSALDGLRIPVWPWPGEVVLDERRPGRLYGDRHWLSHWCYLGTTRDEDSGRPAGEMRFDYDHYRILRRHLDGLPEDAVERVAPGEVDV
ncbi:exonuclease domain-containing protein [Methyloversatilis thermotolerans]|uniref:exonuclease domain-containing protein n=1 Tax=Methyloversatilis thermotolerans TaxID=1346290 RepID=UPI000373F7EC|nr:exonuclease domain-containing protein [Methyloversatilis thermotolerans]